MLLLNGIDGYLEHLESLVETLPCTVGGWGTRAGNAGGEQYWLSHTQSDENRAINIWFADFSDTKYGTVSTPDGTNDSIVKNTAPHLSATDPMLVMLSIASDSSKTLYVGNSTGVLSTINLPPGIATHNRFYVGARRVAGGPARDFAKAALGEIFALNFAIAPGADMTALFAKAKPETIAGCVACWDLEFHQPGGTYVDLVGGKVLTAFGGVTAATGITHPVSRVSPSSAAIAWTEGADVIAAAVNVTISGVAIAAAWTEGADVISIVGAHSTAIGTITTEPMVNNADEVLANETGVIANVYNISTGLLVVQKTGLTSNSLGVVTISDVLIVAGTNYSYEIVLASNGRRLPVALAA